MDVGHLAQSDALSDGVRRAADALLRHQRDDGHWLFELEADATIPAEYVLLEHFLDRIDDELERRIGAYLRANQGPHGGWPLFHDGAFDLSCSVKAYYALRCIGDPADAPHMRRAREAILAAGGAERSNVFTRVQLALFGQVPWRAVPVMPLEIMHLPLWFPFHLSKVSYWLRTVIVPLLVLMALRPRARNPRGIAVGELFRQDPERITDWIRGPYRSNWGRFFKGVDSLLRATQPAFPKASREAAIRKAIAFVTERLNGEDGLGGIYPAMANSVMMFDTLGYEPDEPPYATAWQAVRKLLVVEPDRAYCQPCLSPIWDTGLAGHAIAEAGLTAPVESACAWLRGRQITRVRGDWAVRRPDLPPGGWAFQYWNDYYPDVDDTAVVGMLLHRQGDPAHAEAIRMAQRWIVGMQSTGRGRFDGGWGAFEPENTHLHLNHIPFADHGALLDPPTADVTARCVSFLVQTGMSADDPVIRRALAFLRREQEPDGSWFGRWGTNYIYGTWSVLCALNAAGVPHDDPAVARGIAWLTQNQRADGEWDELPYNAVGFPRVFYLRYHGYRMFFPLLALARYRNLQRGNSRQVAFGF